MPVPRPRAVTVEGEGRVQLAGRAQVVGQPALRMDSERGQRRQRHAADHQSEIVALLAILTRQPYSARTQRHVAMEVEYAQIVIELAAGAELHNGTAVDVVAVQVTT